MIYNFATYLKNLYPCFKDDRVLLEKIKSKVENWKASNENLVTAIIAEMAGEVVKRELAFGSEKGRIDLTNDDKGPIILREFSNNPNEKFTDNFYKLVLNFINNKFFKFTLNQFIKFTLDTNSLTSVRMSTFLLENNVEVGDISIQDYLANLKADEGDKRKQMEHHVSFFYSLGRRIKGEDAATSYLMAAWLLFELVSAPDWMKLIKNENVPPSASDTSLLLMEHAYKNPINETTDIFFNTIFPHLEKAIHSYECNKSIPSLDEKNIVHFMLSSYVASLFSKSLMKLYLSVRTLYPFMNINEILTIKKIDEKNKSIILLWGNYRAIVPIIPDAHEVVLLNILELAKDKDIFQGLYRRRVFADIKIDEALLSEHDINIATIVNALYGATNESTIKMWNQINAYTAGYFRLSCEKESKKFTKRYPTVEIVRHVNCLKNYLVDYGKDNMENLLDLPQAFGLPTHSEGTQGLQASFMNMNQLFIHLAQHTNLLPYFYDNHAEIIPYLNRLLISQLELSELKTKMMGVKLFKETIEAIGKLSKNEKIYEKLLPVKFLETLQQTSLALRNDVFNLLPLIKSRYENLLATQKEERHKQAKKKTVTSSGISKTLKEVIIAQQQDALKNQSIVPVSVPIKSSKRKKKSSKKKSAEVKKAPLELNQKEKDNFLECMRALVGGDETIKMAWMGTENNQLGFVRLNFSDVGHVFKVHAKLGQNYQSLTLTLEARDEFLNRSLPVLHKNHLEKDASILIESDGISFIPKNKTCSYPESVLDLAYRFLENNCDKGAQLQNETLRMFGKKKTHKTTTSLISQPEDSLVTKIDPPKKEKPDEEEKKDEKPKVRLLNAPLLIKTFWQHMVEERFPDQAFNFITVKEDTNRLVIDINMKGAPCLSDKNQAHVDTYLVMRSIARALKGQYGNNRIVIVPDSLDPSEYEKKDVCQIILKGTKNDWKNYSENPEQDLKVSFRQHLEEQETISVLLKKYKKREQAAKGYQEQLVMIAQPEIKDENKLYQKFQQRLITKQQYACLRALFKEIKDLNDEILSVDINNKLFLRAIESRKFVCYHRVFHHLSFLFTENKDHTNSLYMMTLRHIFRHGYLETSEEFSKFIDELMAEFMNKHSIMEVNSLLAEKGYKCVSFNIPKKMYDQLAHTVMAFVQTSSHHAIGDATLGKRMELVADLKDAIGYVESSKLDDKQRKLLVVAITSRIGEVVKMTPYVEVYRQLGMHDENTMMILPDQLDENIYESICYANKKKFIKN